jgi:hypothetical protein
MLLKRLYDRSDPKSPKVNGVKILRAGARQNFSPDLLQQGVAQGWISLPKGKVVLHAQGGVVTYVIKRGPGYYCCHCGKSVDDAITARAHLEVEHRGEASPDKQNPSGYCRLNHFECVSEVTLAENATAPGEAASSRKKRVRGA